MDISQWISFAKRRQFLITVTAICVTLIIIGHHFWIVTALATSDTSIPYNVFKPNQKIHDSMLDDYSGEIKMSTTKTRGNLAKRLPQCIIIGARKGGTQALVEFLRIHPRIKIGNKEIHFFDYDNKYKKGLEYYRNCMPLSYENQITLEKSPRYLIREAAARRIYEYDKKIKLLVTLRHPVKRLISDYWHVKRNQAIFQHKTLEDVVLNRETGDINRTYEAVYVSMYYIHIKRFLQYFPIKQIHVVDGDALIANPVKEMEKIQSFLGLQHYLTNKTFYFDRVKGFYCYMKEQKQKCLSEQKGHSHPPIDPLLYQKLVDFFEPYNQKLYALLGYSFDWK